MQLSFYPLPCQFGLTLDQDHHNMYAHVRLQLLPCKIKKISLKTKSPLGNCHVHAKMTQKSIRWNPDDACNNCKTFWTPPDQQLLRKYSFQFQLSEIRIKVSNRYARVKINGNLWLWLCKAWMILLKTSLGKTYQLLPHVAYEHSRSYAD